MRFVGVVAAIIATAATAAAQSATVVVEASHCGAGCGLTNTTITVPLGPVYTNAALDEVSTLFLTGASGVALGTITCTPYRNDNGTGTAGLPFNSTTPSLLSTNTVQVGSLVCTSASASGSVGTSAASTTPSSSGSYSNTTAISSGSYSNTTAISSGTPRTSVFVTTITGPGNVASASTITSVEMGITSATSTSGSTNPGGPIHTTSASASPSLGAAVRPAPLSDWVFQGMVMAGVGMLAAV